MRIKAITTCKRKKTFRSVTRKWEAVIIFGIMDEVLQNGMIGHPMMG